MKKTSQEESINQKIKNLAKELNIGDFNRIRIILMLERLIARLTSNTFLVQ